MKQNVKFFTIVISLLLLSSIILAGCMHVIAADNGEMKPYDLNVQKENNDNDNDNDNSVSGGIVDDAPTSQTELQNKFNAYLHEDGNTVTIFSKEQYAELKAVRENGNRNPLTSDEILFLVNDSINLYFTYDEIILSNANRDAVIPVASNQSYNDRVIYPKYRDAAAYDTYHEAATAYNKMLVDIYEIIYYRIYMHDAGFETVHHTNDSGKDNIFGNRYNSDLGTISSATTVHRCQMLAIDGAAFSGIENEKKLVGEYGTMLGWKKMCEMDRVVYDFEHYERPLLNSDVLYTDVWDTYQSPTDYKFYIVGNKLTQQIYPTTELENMMPHSYFRYDAKDGYGSYNPVSLCLDYKTGRFSINACKFIAPPSSLKESPAASGKFDESDGVLWLHPENGSAYLYVFYKSDNGYVYSAAESKPLEREGLDWLEDLVFEKVCEGVSVTKP